MSGLSRAHPARPANLQLGNSNGGGPYGGSQARSPVYEAWMYDPYAPAGSRFKVMAASPFKRLYHSVAMLMPDANVLVMGSEQGEGRRPPVGGAWLWLHCGCMPEALPGFVGGRCASLAL